jgi:hypothetical protein
LIRELMTDEDHTYRRASRDLRLRPARFRHRAKGCGRSNPSFVDPTVDPLSCRHGPKIAEIGRHLWQRSDCGQDRAVSKSRAAILSTCLAAIPLLGCAGGVTATSQQVVPPPPADAQYPAAPRFDQTSGAAPAAVLVVLPGAGAFAADPALWASAGVDIVMPPPSAFDQLAADQQQALRQMMAAAERLAAAPVWVIGPQQEIEAAFAAPGPGEEQILGIVETSSGSPAGTCSKSFSYFDPGAGTKPQVKVEKSGNCPPDAGFGIGGPTMAPMVPATPMAPPVTTFRPNAPRVIEGSAGPDSVSPVAQRAAIERIARLIKAGPSS